MIMKVQCAGCGEDCSHAYATWKGDPYHFGCIPVKPKWKIETADERYDREQQEIRRIHDETAG